MEGTSCLVHETERADTLVQVQGELITIDRETNFWLRALATTDAETATRRENYVDVKLNQLLVEVNDFRFGGKQTENAIATGRLQLVFRNIARPGVQPAQWEQSAPFRHTGHGLCSAS